MTNTTHRPAKLGGLSGLVLWAALIAPQAAGALDLALPSAARETFSETTEPDSYRLPTGPWVDGVLPTVGLEGRVTRAAWRIGNQSLTTLQVLQPLRDQLESQGYEVLYQCQAADCGGFDFRFGIDVLQAPAMYVNLSDYRYLAAWQPDALRHVSLLVSRTGQAGFVQLIQVVPKGQSDTPDVQTLTPSPAPLTPGSVTDRLQREGYVILSDLTFASGSSDLGEGSFASLADLAAFLAARPDRRLALVGHTDAVGSLEGNIALSQRRANSVRARLLQTYNVPAEQVEARGVGYLSPFGTNDTPAGRDANRRVEAVLLPR